MNVSGLSTGTYTATITVSDPNASNSPQTISVTLNISQKAVISLSKTSLSFSTIEDTNPSDETFTITNTGGSTLNWTVSSDATWLTLNPTSGALSNGSKASVTASVNVSGLSTGTYTATITVSDRNTVPTRAQGTGAGTYTPTITVFDPNASNSPQTISVTLNIFSLEQKSGSKIRLGNNLFNPSIGGTAKIWYTVPSSGNVSLKIYDISGKLIRTVFDGYSNSGTMYREWNGKNDGGSNVSPGVYILRYVYPGGKEDRKIGVMK